MWRGDHTLVSRSVRPVRQRSLRARGRRPCARCSRAGLCRRPVRIRPQPGRRPWRAGRRPRSKRCADPGSFAIAAGDPGSWSGPTKLDNSIPVPPSGGRSMTISVRESGMPMTVSRNSPSTNVRPSTSRPNPTKNAVTESRSSTAIPTWSKRLMCDIAAILQRWSEGLASGTMPPQHSRHTHIRSPGPRNPTGFGCGFRCCRR